MLYRLSALGSFSLKTQLGPRSGEVWIVFWVLHPPGAAGDLRLLCGLSSNELACRVGASLQETRHSLALPNPRPDHHPHPHAARVDPDG